MTESSFNSKVMGLLFGILSSTCYTMYSVLFKKISSLSIPEVILIRGITQAILTLPLLIFLQNNILGEEGSRLLIWSGALVTTGLAATNFLAVKILPLGDAMAIEFSNPVLIMVLSYCFFKEHCGIFKTLAVGLLLIGITFITKPPGLNQVLGFSPSNESVEKSSSLPLYYGYIAAFSSTIGYAFLTLSRKRLSTSTHFSVISFSCALVHILASCLIIPLISSFSVPQDWADIVYGVAIGGLSCAGQMFIVLALKRLDAGVVAVAGSLEIVFAYMVQIFWFGESTDVASMLGAGAVVLSVISIAQEQSIVKMMEKCWKPSNETE